MKKLSITADMGKVLVRVNDGKVREVKDHGDRTFRLDKNWKVFVSLCPQTAEDERKRLGESLVYG